MITIIPELVAVIAVLLFLAIGFVKNRENKKVSYLILALSAIYVISFVLHTLWLFDYYSYSEGDFLSLICIVVMVQAFVLFFFTSLFKKSNYSKMIMTLYVLNLLFILLSPLRFSIFAIIASFFFMLLILLNLTDNEYPKIRRIGSLGMIYSGLSIIFSFLFFLGLISSFFLGLAINFFFILIAYNLSKYLPYPAETKANAKKIPLFLIFIKYLIFICAFTNIILISTLSIHELSHVAVARFYNCDAKAIFFENGVYPYSEINCLSTSNLSNLAIALAGPVIPVIFALILFFLEKSITRAIALEVMGFNLIAAYKDLKQVQVSDSMIFITMFIGAILLMLGLYYLTKFILGKENLSGHSSVN